MAPLHWRSVADLAACRQLPAPMLEQLLLKLRRAGLVEARRGRHGGYRLRRPAAAIPVAAILSAVGATTAWQPDLTGADPIGSGSTGADPGVDEAGERVTEALQRRLRRALERELAQLSLEELLFDLHSARASLTQEGGMLLG